MGNIPLADACLQTTFSPPPPLAFSLLSRSVRRHRSPFPHVIATALLSLIQQTGVPRYFAGISPLFSLFFACGASKNPFMLLKMPTINGNGTPNTTPLSHHFYQS
jgi:hypothetical protein